ncbi:MAG TPA: AMP-binding protein, partial [Chitinophagaceae bacterium]|nr:AMP-binding protein [Chitinophagaceae bacterium]
MTGEPFIYRQQNSTKQARATRNYSFNISGAAASRMLGMTNGNDAGIFSCVLSAVGLVLNRYSGQKEVTVDTALLDASENALPVFFLVSSGSTIRQYLNTVQETIGNAYMQEDETAQPAASQTNVFIHFAVIHSSLPELQGYDLVFALDRNDEAISIGINYNEAYFDAQFIERMKFHLESVFSSYADLDKLVEEIDILSNEERATILNFNSLPVDYPKNKTVIELFEEQVARSPSALAVDSITYKELDEQAGKLAKYLQEQSGIKPGDIVGIMANRSSRLITGILGALKAGAAYLPIDPNYPRERQQHMLTEAEVKVLLTDSEFMFGVDFFEGELFMLDMQLEMLEAGEPKPASTTSNDVAYVIYTSGSTGTPKGVMIKHASLINLCNWHCREFGVTQDSR